MLRLCTHQTSDFWCRCTLVAAGSLHPLAEILRYINESFMNENMETDTPLNAVILREIDRKESSV